MNEVEDLAESTKRLLSQDSLQLAQQAGGFRDVELAQVDLALDALDDLVDLVVGQVDAEGLFQQLHRVADKALDQVGVAGQLGDDIGDDLLDIHGVVRSFRFAGAACPKALYPLPMGIASFLYGFLSVLIGRSK